MNKVPEPKLVFRQVDGIRRRSRPQTLCCHDAVVFLSIAARVTVGEAGKAAVEAADGEEDAVQVLPGGIAVAVVGDDGVEELKQEDGAGRKKLY